MHADHRYVYVNVHAPVGYSKEKAHLARLRFSLWFDHLSARWNHAFGRVFDFYL